LKGKKKVQHCLEFLSVFELLKSMLMIGWNDGASEASGKTVSIRDLLSCANWNQKKNPIKILKL